MKCTNPGDMTISASSVASMLAPEHPARHRPDPSISEKVPTHGGPPIKPQSPISSRRLSRWDPFAPCQNFRMGPILLRRFHLRFERWFSIFSGESLPKLRTVSSRGHELARLAWMFRSPSSPSSPPSSPPWPSSPSLSSRRRWPGSICMGSPWLRGAQGLSGGSTHAVSSGGGGKRVGGIDAGNPAKALGVARSDLEPCADLQATLRPEKSTSGVL
jgi:hypothetical protein